MFKATKNRKLIWLNLILGLSSVFCASVSTFAWFQINSQAPEATITTKDPHLSVDNENTTGYKVNHVIGSDGFIDKTSTTVTSKKGQTYDTSNNNQATSDHNFDIPSAGLGYYLVKKNPGDTYKYNYEGGGTYSWKFKEFSDSSVNYLTIDASMLGAITTTDRFVVKSYSYDAGNYKTVNAKIDISKDTGDFSVDSTTYEITPTSAGSFNIWLNKATKKISFETPVNLTTLNKKSARALRNAPGPKKAVVGASDGSNYNRVFLWLGNVGDSGNNWSSSSARLYAKFTFSGGGTTELEMHWLTGNDRDAVWYVDVSSLASAPTNVNFRRFSSSGNTGSPWNQTGNVAFDSAKNFFSLSGWNGANAYGYNSTWYVYNDNCFQTASQLYLYSSMNAYNGNEITSGSPKTINFTANSTIKVYRTPVRRLFGFASYGSYGDNVWLHASGHISGGSTYFTADGDSNVKASQDINNVSLTFTYTSDSTYTYSFSFTTYTVTYHYYFQGYTDNSATENTSMRETATAFASTTFTAKAVPTQSGYTKSGWYESSSLTGATWSSGVLTANKHLYAKYVEEPITVYLKDYYSDTTSGADGSVGSNTMALDTNFGAATVVTVATLKSLWNASYNDAITRNGIRYTYSRIETSAHTSAFSSGTIEDGTTLYVRYYRNRYTITLTPSYFEPTGTNQLNFNIQDSSSQVILDGNAFSTSNTFANCEYKDHTNGVWYVFARSGSSWYSDAACTTQYTGNPSSNMTLYAKMVAYPLTTLYIDADYPGWNNVYLHMWGTLGGFSSDMNNSLTAKPITDDSGNRLYRISIPTQNINGFLLHAGGNSGQQTVDIATSSLTGSTSKYCYVAGDTANARTATFTEYKSTSATGVYVRKWNGSSFVNVAGGELMHGDGVGNDYILESGLQLSSGDVIQVYDTNTSTAYGYNKYIDGNKDKHPYIATGQSGNGITLSHFTNNARFNFYVTHTGYLSIAMVPDYGNGYYIMNYNESIFSSSYVTDVKNNQGGDLSLLTQHYCGAIKMDSNDYSAIYTGYYTAGGAGHRIFIRSYLNAVDTLADTLTGASSSYATIDHGVITFTTSGRYTIQVTNKTIDISPYSVNDFFKLNSLDTSTVTGTTAEKTAAIHRQQTSLILEIPFTCNNPYASNITLLTDCSASYIGVNLYVSSSSLGTGAQIYTTLRGGTLGTPSSFYSGLTAANTSTPITDKNNCVITANSGSTYYAYVLIDYMPGVTQSDLTGSAPEFKLYLQSNQP